MVAVRLHQGKAADVRGAARFLAEALTTVRAIAPKARIVVRADSTFYTADVAATAIRYGADVSLTTGSNPSVNATIGRIPDTAWTAMIPGLVGGIDRSGNRPPCRRLLAGNGGKRDRGCPRHQGQL
jgi:hypothetical protein